MQNKMRIYPAVYMSAKTGTKDGFYTVSVTGSHI